MEEILYWISIKYPDVIRKVYDNVIVLCDRPAVYLEYLEIPEVFQITRHENGDRHVLLELPADVEFYEQFDDYMSRLIWPYSGQIDTKFSALSPSELVVAVSIHRNIPVFNTWNYDVHIEPDIFYIDFKSDALINFPQLPLEKESKIEYLGLYVGIDHIPTIIPKNYRGKLCIRGTKLWARMSAIKNDPFNQ